MVHDPPDGSAETPEQLKQRANDLRDCARTARTVAGALGPYLDKAVASAAPTIWTGPYASTTTTMLTGHKSSLHQMASDLTRDAARWDTEARDLDDQAAKAKKPATGGG